MIDLNKNQDIVVLSFSFEMLSSRQVGRKLSYKLKRTTSELYSASGKGVISEQDYRDVEEKAAEIVDYPVYYVDTAGSVQEIGNTTTLIS